jgi:hypothetical protein
MTGKNATNTPPEVILDQMSQQRPLPLGRKEFDEWSDRIIAGAMITATHESQKFSLAEMIMHIKPTQSFCDDGHFINSLRKAAANEVAYAVMQELRQKKLDRLKAEEDAKKFEAQLGTL